MRWVNVRFYETFVYFLFFYFTLEVFPPTAIAGLTLAIAAFNFLRNPGDTMSNYVLLFVASIFYNAYHEEIFFKTFSRSDSSTALAISANWLGLAFLVQLFFTGELHRFRFRWQKLDTLLLIFLIVLLFSALVGVNFDLSLEELKRYPSFIGFYFITRVSLSSMRRLREMLSVFYATLLIVFIITIQKAMIGAQYGALTDFVFLLSPVLHLKLKELKHTSLKEIMPVLILAVGSLSLLISDSRRVLMSVSLIWLSAFSAKRFTTLAFVVIIPIVILLQVLEVGVEFRYEQSADQVKELLKGGADENVLRQLTTGRSELWAAGLNLIAHYPFFGVGLENHIELLPSFGAYTTIRIHNVFLDVTAQTGLVGLFVFVWILAHLLTKLRRIKRTLKEQGLITHAVLVNSLFISFIAVIVVAFFGGSILLGKWGWFQVAFLAATILAMEKELKSITSKKANNS